MWRPLAASTATFRSSRGYRLLVGLVWIGVAATLVGLLLHHARTLPVGPRGWNDSYVYLTSATRFVSHPSHLYDAAQRQLTHSSAQRAFIYPPSALLPFLALAPLAGGRSIHAAAIIWASIDLVALLTALILVARRAGFDWLSVGIALLLITHTTPLRWEADSGQVNGAVLLLLTLSAFRYPGRSSGVLMGLALALKPVAALVLLIPLLRRRPMVSLIAALTFIAVNLPFLPLVGWQHGEVYLTSVLPFLLGYVIHDPSNISLPNVLQAWLGGGPLPRHGAFSEAVPHAAGALLVLWLTRVAVAGVWLRAALDQRIDHVTVFALSLATVPVLTATVWAHYFVYLLPLALMLWRAPDLGVRLAAGAAVLWLLFQGNVAALWFSPILLWPAATVMLTRRAGWRMPPLLGRGAVPRGVG